MLLSLFRSRVSRRPRVARALSSSAAPSPSCLEPLETRRLLAADPCGTAALAGGVLEVKGTRRADEIRVDLIGTTGQLDVTINGAAAGSFNTADAPGGVRVDAGGGNDS